MTESTLTELALRAGVNSTKREISSDSNSTEDIKSASLKRIQELIGGNSTLSNLATKSNLQALAIGAAIKGLELSYSAVKEQLTHLKDKRLAFDKERQAGIATFIIPNDKEERELSKQERVMKAFIKLVNKNQSFATYLGIHIGVLADLKDANFYSVLPFYRMSEGIVQPVSSPGTLDKQRVAITLFFKSALPETIADIENEFQTESKFFEFFKSAYKKENYLNDFRAPRFIIMSLANLVWNLQHPVDPETGFPLGTERIIELCREIEQFLNTLLNIREANSVQEINSEIVPVLSFVRKVENHVKALRTAYTEEQLYELNFSDLTNSAHRTLRIMDKSVFQLIYKRINPLTKKEEPNRGAAEEISYMVSYLNQLLIYNPDLLKAFVPFASLANGTPYFNNPPLTILDAIITFIHCTRSEKEQLLTELEKNKNDYASEFISTFRSLNNKYISPIKAVSKKELKPSIMDKRSRESAKLTARRLIPFLTLVIEDFRIEIDTNESYKQARRIDKKSTAPTKYLGKEQVIAINKLAEKGDGYYVWLLSPFIEIGTETEKELDQLPKHQYRFTEITKLLDSVSDIVQNYRSFLQLKSFQLFLIKCLSKLKDEFNLLEHHIEKVDYFLSKDKSMNRNMQSILKPMTKDLNSSLEAFSMATTTFEHIICAPDFIDQQKQLLANKLDAIHQQFMSLFSEDSGIADMINATFTQEIAKEIGKVSQNTDIAQIPSAISKRKTDSLIMKPVILPIEQPIDAKKILALKQVVQQCLDSLSYQSKYTEKGRLLNNLLILINKKTNFTQESFSQAIKELARVTLSYRNTWFFQAAYAETRSAMALISALKNPELNGLLALTPTLFKKEIDLSYESDAELIKRLRNLGTESHWEESAEELNPVLII